MDRLERDAATDEIADLEQPVRRRDSRRGEQIVVEEPETDIWSRMMLEVLSVLVPEGLL